MTSLSTRPSLLSARGAAQQSPVVITQAKTRRPMSACVCKHKAAHLAIFSFEAYPMATCEGRAPNLVGLCRAPFTAVSYTHLRAHETSAHL
eukprot:13059849-Alexandrium_andersonii.AAC.1